MDWDGMLTYREEPHSTRNGDSVAIVRTVVPSRTEVTGHHILLTMTYKMVLIMYNIELDDNTTMFISIANVIADLQPVLLECWSMFQVHMVMVRQSLRGSSDQQCRRCSPGFSRYSSG